MMEIDNEQISFNSSDQLYHILKTDTFTFCLMCFEDINSTSDDVGKHLRSENHLGKIKRLFKACNPSLLDDIEDNRCTDIVLKSVFDISVLLGKESCYVCKKDDYWFCLMCEQSVTGSYLFDAAVKDNIIDHVLSETHVKKVKEVCFLYRFNANQDFLLLNKSVVYCSICKDVMQCREVELLNTATVHLQKKHPNYAKPLISDDFQCETQEALIKSEEQEMTDEEFKSTDGGISGDYPITKIIPRTELAREVKDEKFDDLYKNDKSVVDIVKENFKRSNVPVDTEVNKSFDENQYFNVKSVCFCWYCKNEIKILSGQSFVVSIKNHFKEKHQEVFIKSSLKGLMNKVIIHNDPDKIKLISKKVKIRKSLNILFDMRDCLVHSHAQLILKTKTDYLCILCLVSMSPCIDNDIVVLDNLHNHFISSSHRKLEEEKKEANKTVKVHNRNKTTIKSTQENDKLCLNGESLVQTVQDTSMNRNVTDCQNIRKQLNEQNFFDDRTVCICLLCKVAVSRVSGWAFLVSVDEHFRNSHQNIYIKTPLQDLINKVIFLNDPDKIKLISHIKIVKKSLKKKIKKVCEVKKKCRLHLKDRKRLYLHNLFCQYVTLLR